MVAALAWSYNVTRSFSLRKIGEWALESPAKAELKRRKSILETEQKHQKRTILNV